MTTTRVLPHPGESVMEDRMEHGGSDLAPLRRRWFQRPSSLRSIQIGLGGLWLLDGLLQLQPHMFTSAFVAQVLEPSSQGQAGWISWLVGANAHLVSTNVAAWDALFACVQLLIGLGLMIRSTVKPALALSFAWSLGVWVFGEGLGMVFTGMTSPLMGAPGAALLYAVMSLVVWPARNEHEASPGSGGPGSKRLAWLRDGSVRSAVSAGLFGDLWGRMAWAALWTLDAVLWLLPSNTARGAVGRQISSMASGEPSWLSHLLESAGHLFSATTSANATSLAAVSLVIGVGPLVSRRAGPYLFAGAVLSLIFWVFGQAFGGIFTGPVSGTATDPNIGPLVVLMALGLMQSPARPPDVRFSSAYPHTPTNV